MRTSIQTNTNVSAILSLIFGITCWIALYLIGAIIAVICGHIARHQIRRAAPGTIKGNAFAIAGLFLGYANLIFILFLTCLAWHIR